MKSADRGSYQERVRIPSRECVPDRIVESTSPKHLQSEQAMTFWLGKAIHSRL